MKNHAAIILVFITVIRPEISIAQNYDISTVGGLYDTCQQVIKAELEKEYDKKAYGLCFGYFRGVKNSYDIKQLAGEKGNICTPPKSTWLDYIKEFLKWVKRNPQNINIIAWTGVINSLSEAYPCAKQ